MEQKSLQERGVTILVVDDEPIVLKLTRTVLEREGYTVLEARSGQEALVVAETFRNPIHLLMVDHLLHNFTGREIAEHLKIARPEMRVMHMSGYLFAALQEDGSLTPGAAFLQKPFRNEDLMDAVRKLNLR